MSAECFIDTNLFRQGVETSNTCISFQVQECLNTVLRKAEIPRDAEGARAYLETVLAPLFRVPASIALYHHGLDIQARYRYGFYDALIIEADTIR